MQHQSKVGKPALHIPSELSERFQSFLDERPGFDNAHLFDLTQVFLYLEGQRAALDDGLRALAPVIATVSTSPAFIEDVLQELKLKLLVQKQVARYGGRGPLGGWLRRVALNTALTMKGVPLREGSTRLDGDVVQLHPELDFLKQRYRAAFAEAFTAALQRLSTRERTLLRLNALGDASIDDLAVVYRVHRATVARWIQGARRSLLEHTRETLVATLSLDEVEVCELMQLLRSQLDVSLQRLLQDDPLAEAPHLEKTAEP